MKFDCGEPRWKKQLRKEHAWHSERQKWRPYFAWLPIRLNDNDCRWLEWVETRDLAEFVDGWGYHYKTQYREAVQ